MNYLPCVRCGKPTRGSAPPERRACRPCRQKEPLPHGPRANPTRRRKPAPEPRICVLCEESYIPNRGARPDQRWCSKSCAQAWRNGARPPYLPRFKGMDRASAALARSRERRLRHAHTWDGITDEEILERDGWRCQVPGCKRRPIRKDATYPHPRSKSVDHVVPLSHGGDDTAANKRAAHLGCNMERGNRITADQLALFGSVREAPLTTVTAGERAALLQRRKRFCECGAVPLDGRKFCQDCLDRRSAAAEDRRAKKLTSPVHYYTCRYCGDLKVCKRTGQLREVCSARNCQLARLAANNLRVRRGMTAEEADALVAEQVAAATGPGYGRWRRRGAA